MIGISVDGVSQKDTCSTNTKFQTISDNEIESAKLDF